MPSPALGSVQANPWLSNVSIGYKNPGYQLQDRVFRSLSVTKTKGTYVLWPKAEGFSNEAEVVRPGGYAPRGCQSFTTATYETESYQYGEEIYDDIVDEAEAIIGDQIKSTEYATDKVLLAVEKAIATALTTTGNWTTTESLAGAEWDTGGDPIGKIGSSIATVEGLIGIAPNTIAMDWGVAWTLRTHAAIRDYIKFTGQAPTIASDAVLAQVFGVPNFVVSTGKYNTSRKNATASLSRLMSDTVWIGYVSPVPAKTNPSAGYGFSVSKPPIYTYREDKFKRDVIEARKDYVCKVTAAGAGATLTNTMTAF